MFVGCREDRREEAVGAGGGWMFGWMDDKRAAVALSIPVAPAWREDKRLREGGTWCCCGEGYDMSCVVCVSVRVCEWLCAIIHCLKGG